MDARDISAIGDVLAEGFDNTTQRVQEAHRAVARRSFVVAGPARTRAERLHDRISARIYSAVRVLGPAVIRSSALGLGAAVDRDAARIQGSPRGKAVVSAFNGVFGDALTRRRNGLALAMAVNADGRHVWPTPPELAAAFPSATTRIALFVHGFGETDDSWRWWSEAHWGAPDLSYGELLRRECGYTPVFIHYNSGRKVCDNAAELSALLEGVIDGWPLPVDELVLVGHSAGGVVARAAVRYGAAQMAPWVATVSDVVSIGVPRHALAAEALVAGARRMLARLPETSPIAKLLDARSQGLKDLPDHAEQPLPRGVNDVRLPRDGLRVNHFKLLNHPAVYEQLKRSLSGRTVPVRLRVAREGRYVRAAKALRGRRPSRRR
jgi:pimeloyl-ACP methyl ester carboxylesterase